MIGRGFLIKYVIELKEGVDMRKILVVIDMQNDFIDAALGTKEAVAIVDAVKEKEELYGNTGGTELTCHALHQRNGRMADTAGHR